MCLSCPLQPGKLTEAFKYFLQGMGYSEYISTPPHLQTSGQAVLGWGVLFAGLARGVSWYWGAHRHSFV